MLSKNTIKRLTSLGQKKYRHREGLFVAEGVKVIKELLHSSLELSKLFVEENTAFAKALKETLRVPHEEVSSRALSRVTFLKTPQTALATFKIPSIPQVERKGLTLVLDDVRDPGNLGTIIRLCDWFGVEQLVCSKNTVDCYNPKVVQATMGSLTRVAIVYTEVVDYLREEVRPIYGTFMNGENIYRESLPQEAVVVMGNEANGISSSIEKQISTRLAIPRYGKDQAVESLNVAMATSICLSEFKRRS